MALLSRLLVFLLLLAPAAARADDPGAVYTLDGKASNLTFHLVHKLHKFDIRATHLEGKGRLVAGNLQAMVRAPIDGFDSANVNRDAHAKEILEAARFPTLEAKAFGALVTPTSFPATVETRLTMQIALHGVSRQVEVPASVTFESAARAHGKLHFSVSLESFNIERPSLMFVKMEDAVNIDGDLVFTR